MSSTWVKSAFETGFKVGEEQESQLKSQRSTSLTNSRRNKIDCFRHNMVRSTVPLVQLVPKADWMFLCGYETLHKN